MENKSLLVNDAQIKNAQILIVDDEPINISLLKDILEVDGYQNLTTTTDALEAVELYQSCHFDLVLLDISMPVMDGFQVIQHFQQKKLVLPPPILVITALHDHETCHRAFAMGAKDFVTKPFDYESTLCRVSNLLNMQLSHCSLWHYGETLELRVQERTKELIDTQLQIVKHLSNAAEYRDNETAAHTIRVGWYSKVLAEHVGLSTKEQELILNTAPMHDVGKIGIPDHILLKPGKFDPHERVIMNTHTTIGAEILSHNKNKLIQTARTIALTHHEKWNGKGYPNGLAGEDIPIQGRIVMVADVFDALTMQRPYKKAWPIEDAVALIKEESGTSFDPRLVDIFLDILPEFIAIREKYHD